VLWEACREAAQTAGITKDVRPHLRGLQLIRLNTPLLISFIQSFENAFEFHSGSLPNWPRPPQTRSLSFKRLNLN
jgi:hypothetical protein